VPKKFGNRPCPAAFLFSLLLACLLFMVAPASAQDAGNSPPLAVEQQQEPAEAQSLHFYTLQDDTDRLPPGPLSRHLLRLNPLAAKGPHPMVQWYYWANQRKPFGPALLFVLFFTLVSWAVMPGWLRRAEEPLRQRFWTTLFVGALVTAVFLTAGRVALRALIGWPLAVVVYGLLELSLLVGLSAVVSMLGQSMGSLVRLQRWPLVGKRADARRFTELFIGSLICALFLQIPALGPLPKLGTRLVGLLAVLGLGALFRTRAR
jgi:hypothetical protein